MHTKSTGSRLAPVMFTFGTLLLAACHPPSQASVQLSGADGIVNGEAAKTNDVAANGPSESVVAIQAEVSMPDAHGTTQQGQMTCTGTLIDRRVVLTAAHCLQGITTQQTLVGLHFRDLLHSKSEQVGASVYHVKSFLMNPGFHANGTGIADDASGKIQDDVGLILLEEPVPEGTRLATLPSSIDEVQKFSSALAIGYGVADDRVATEPADRGVGILRSARITADRLGMIPPAAQGKLAGAIIALAGPTSICQGDSGGPLMGEMDGASKNVVMGINESTAAGFKGQVADDYLTAMKSGHPENFVLKHPSARTCIGGTNVFVNVALASDWINHAKAQLLGETAPAAEPAPNADAKPSVAASGGGASTTPQASPAPAPSGVSSDTAPESPQQQLLNKLREKFRAWKNRAQERRAADSTTII